MSNNKESIRVYKSDEWDLEVYSKSRFFEFNFKELWKYKDLMFLFVKRDFVATYKQTLLGPLWNFIQPVFTTLMFMVVFHGFANISTDGIKAPLFYMSGITIWNYFSSCLTGTSNTFISNAGIFGKVYFPRLISPISVVISNIVRFGIQFFLLILVMIFYSFKGVHFYFGWDWLLIIPLLVIMAGLGLGLGIIISSLTTKYRDLAVLIGFGVQLMMYATPVAYPLSYLTGKSYKWLITLNPLSSLIEAFRSVLFHKSSFNPESLIYSSTFMLITLITGFLIFNKVERGFMDTV